MYTRGRNTRMYCTEKRSTDGLAPRRVSAYRCYLVYHGQVNKDKTIKGGEAVQEVELLPVWSTDQNQQSKHAAQESLHKELRHVFG